MNEEQGTEVRVYRRTRASHFTTLPNSLIRNQLPVRISSVAYRLASILLSFPEQGWKTSRDELARRYFTEGVKQIQKALAELAKAGLFRRRRVREASGTFSWTWEIADEPIFLDHNEEGHKTAGHTSEQKPLTGDENRQTKPQVTPVSKNHSLVNHSLVSDSMVSSFIERTPPSSIPPPPSDGEKTQVEEGETSLRNKAETLLAGLPNPWHLGPKSTGRLVPLVVAALRGDEAAPWSADALAAELSRDPEGVRSPLAVLKSRLSDLPPPPVPKTAKTRSKPSWCGQCSEFDRTVEAADNRVKLCPNCHPRSKAKPS